MLADLATGPDAVRRWEARTVVVTVTGHGLKDTATALEPVGAIVDVVVDADADQAASAAGLV